MDKKANVLVMGNSGVGKSTLINTVYRFEKAGVGIGSSVTDKMTIYESKEVNFRAIDTKGLEYGMLAQIQTKNSIKKWSKSSVKDNKEEKYIHMIWYCMDATSKRLFHKNLDTIQSVAKMWKDVPIIIILTKSYSEAEIDENTEMVRSAINSYKGSKYLNIVDIIPVVSKQYQINNEVIISPMGITQLVEKTNDQIPEAFRINRIAVNEFNIKIKHNNATALVATATSSAAIVGAIPIPIADSLVLMPLQSGMIYGVAKIYGFKSDDSIMKTAMDTIIQSGSVTLVAKGIISALKTIPGINLAASLINAIVAGIITAVLGEITIAIMEKIAKGEITAKDIDFISKFSETEYHNKVGKYLDKIKELLLDNKIKVDGKNIGKLIEILFQDKDKKK